MSLSELRGEELEELVEDLSELRHDLGKYIGFECRFVGEDGETEALRAALRTDLLQTHRGRRGVESCWQLWARLEPADCAGEPELGVISSALASLSEVDLDGSREELLRGVALARQVTEATRSLHRRAALLLDDDDD